MHESKSYVDVIRCYIIDKILGTFAEGEEIDLLHQMFHTMETTST